MTTWRGREWVTAITAGALVFPAVLSALGVWGGLILDELDIREGNDGWAMLYVLLSSLFVSGAAGLTAGRLSRQNRK